MPQETEAEKRIRLEQERRKKAAGQTAAEPASSSAAAGLQANQEKEDAEEAADIEAKKKISLTPEPGEDVNAFHARAKKAGMEQAAIKAAWIASQKKTTTTTVPKSSSMKSFIGGVQGQSNAVEGILGALKKKRRA